MLKLKHLDNYYTELLVDGAGNANTDHAGFGDGDNTGRGSGYYHGEGNLSARHDLIIYGDGLLLIAEYGGGEISDDFSG